MTDKQQALRDLMAKVEAGTIPDTGVDRFSAIPKRGGGVYADPNWYDANAAYWRKSTDAALALHNAVLPGWTLCVGQNAHYGDWSAWVRLVEDGTVTQEIGSMGDDPACALLIAILKALIAKEETS